MGGGGGEREKIFEILMKSADGGMQNKANTSELPSSSTRLNSSSKMFLPRGLGYRLLLDNGSVAS